MTVTTQLEKINCCNCSMLMALPEDFIGRQRKNGGSFWCPSCGTSQGWGGRSESDKLKKVLAEQTMRLAESKERERRSRQDADHFKASRDALKGQITKIKKRAAAGLCPCCNRHFTNLERHMGTKHPGYKNEEPA